MADEDFKDLSRGTASDKVFRDKAFNIAKNSKYDGCQKGLASMVYNFFFFFFLIKSLLKVVALIMKLNKMRNQPKNYTNQLLKHFKKEEFILHLKTIFGGADSADMQLISKFNKTTAILLCVIDIVSKYAWVVPLKNKTVKLLLMLFKIFQIVQLETK